MTPMTPPSDTIASTAGLDWRVERITTGPTGVIVSGHQDGDRIEARACVLACGAQYRFHRDLGLGLPEVFLQPPTCSAARRAALALLADKSYRRIVFGLGARS